MQRIAEGVQHSGEHDHLHRTGQVFHTGKGHHAVGLGGHHAAFYHCTHDAHPFAVLHMGILAGQILDGVGRDPRRLLTVGVQRMAGQVQAADILFLLQQFLVTVFRQLFDLIAVRRCFVLRFPAHDREQIQLAVQIAPGVCFDAFQNAFHRLHLTVAVAAHMVKGTGLDQAFDRPAVQFCTMHPLAEIVQAGVGLILPLSDHILNKVAAHVLDRVQSKTDLTVVICRKSAV